MEKCGSGSERGNSANGQRFVGQNLCHPLLPEWGRAPLVNLLKGSANHLSALTSPT
jgi:hypothetical protein